MSLEDLRPRERRQPHRPRAYDERGMENRPFPETEWSGCEGLGRVEG